MVEEDMLVEKCLAMIIGGYSLRAVEIEIDMFLDNRKVEIMSMVESKLEKATEKTGIDKVNVEDIEDFMAETKCLGCGHEGLQACWYPHSDGIIISGIDEDVPMWVFGHCPVCEYDNAIWKLLKRFNANSKKY